MPLPLSPRLLLPAVAVLLATVLPSAAAPPAAPPVPVSTLPRLGTVSPRFQSFNVEMLEVTGGRFWAPYKKDTSAPPPPPPPPAGATPEGMDPSLYRYRAPIDLSNPRLRKLAKALAPTYMRVSGTWANTTFFQDSDAPAPATPPAGFNGVLTRAQWHGVIDFAHAVDAEIVTSFAISPGVRDKAGVWTPVEASKFLAYTSSVGGKIAAAEMFNEPSFASMGGAPKGYDAAAYGRDFKVFHAFAKQAAPNMLVLGPGGLGEGSGLGAGPRLTLRSVDMLTASEPATVDAFSYHFYGGGSIRCSHGNAPPSNSPENALTQPWLFRTVSEEAFYAKLRDRFAPGKPLWLTETAETACGGDPLASTFIDTFRYLNQLGILAQKGVATVMHNTLAASDYALVDEATLTPRPNFWAAVLWRRLMGTTVLDPGPSPAPDIYLYAHCLRDKPGGVALLAINAGRSATGELTLPVGASRYTLSAPDLLQPRVDLNSAELTLTSAGDLPAINGQAVKAGSVSLTPTTISFFAIPAANNPACRQ